jgi:Tol biopolymer transport system component
MKIRLVVPLVSLVSLAVVAYASSQPPGSGPLSDNPPPTQSTEEGPQVGTPGTDHRVYAYDRTNDRVLYGGINYVLDIKGTSLADSDMSVLYQHDLGMDASREVFRLPGRTLAAYTSSSDGQHIAVRSWANDKLGSMALHVLDSRGQEVARIPHVWDYAWSPDGKQIAYVTGEYFVEREDIRTTGVWRFDVHQRLSTKVHDGGRYVYWATFDQAIYIVEYPLPSGYPRVWKVNSTDWKQQLTQMKSVYLSPTGMYYYHPQNTPYGTFDVFDVATHSPRFSPPSSGLYRRFPWGTEPIGWLDSGGNQLILFTRSNPATGELDTHPHIMLYDCDAGTIVDLGLENVIGWKQGSFITHRHGKFLRERPGDVRHSPPPAR